MNTVSATNNISKNVTQVLGVGTITPASDFTIVFDQTSAGRTANGAGKTFLNDKTEGIYLNLGAETKATYTSNTDTNIVDSITGYKFKTTITISSALANYFDIKAKSIGDWTVERKSANGGNDVVIIFTSVSNSETEFDWENDVEFTYTVNDVSQEPKSITEYNSFKSKVDNDWNMIKVTYTVELNEAINP